MRWRCAIKGAQGRARKAEPLPCAQGRAPLKLALPAITTPSCFKEMAWCATWLRLELGADAVSVCYVSLCVPALLSFLFKGEACRERTGPLTLPSGGGDTLRGQVYAEVTEWEAMSRQEELGDHTYVGEVRGRVRVQGS